MTKLFMIIDTQRRLDSMKNEEKRLEKMRDLSPVDIQDNIDKSLCRLREEISYHRRKLAILNYLYR